MIQKWCRRDAEAPEKAERFVASGSTMKDDQVEAKLPHIERRNPVVAAVLSWLVPGLGQWYQGRRLKAVLFFACTTVLMITGQVLGEGRTIYWSRPDPAFAVPATAVARVRYTLYCMGLAGASRLPVGWVTIPSALQWVARDSGPLPVLDRFAFPPTKAELSELNARLNERWEIAVLYTRVAGLLNVFVIWDAYGGPAVWYYMRRRRQLERKR